MEPITKFTTRTIVLPYKDIDTDQIIPAEYMKGIDKEGLGQHLFQRWRYDAKGKPIPAFPLNKPEAKGAQALVTGDNFGVGSSREHAVWAMVSYGLKAVISTSFADIFYNNALNNALLPIKVPGELHKRIMEKSGQQVTIDLEATTLQLADGTTTQFPITTFKRKLLLAGQTELDYLLGHMDAIIAYEQRRFQK